LVDALGCGTSPWLSEGTMGKQAELTRAERRYLERVAEAQAQGLTLEQYYRASGLSVEWLHNIRRQLRGKGVGVPELSVGTAAAASEVAQGEQFVRVRLRPATTAQAAAVCRLRHPSSGWLLECASWPEVGWMRQLLGEQP
jgi:hypothetical protein